MEKLSAYLSKCISNPFVRALDNAIEKDDIEFVKELLQEQMLICPKKQLIYYDYMYSLLPENQQTITHVIKS